MAFLGGTVEGLALEGRVDRGSSGRFEFKGILRGPGMGGGAGFVDLNALGRKGFDAVRVRVFGGGDTKCRT